MTDDDLNKRFLQAINKLAPRGDLVVLQRLDPDPDAMPNECFTNCQRKVNTNGGAIQCGWLFHGHREISYIVAVAHAVWRSPEGVLIDITPILPVENWLKPVLLLLRDMEGSLVFLLDETAFERPSKFLPLSNNKAIIRACRRWNCREQQLRQRPEAMARRIEQLRGCPERGGTRVWS